MRCPAAMHRRWIEALGCSLVLAAWVQAVPAAPTNRSSSSDAEDLVLRCLLPRQPSNDDRVALRVAMPGLTSGAGIIQAMTGRLGLANTLPKVSEADAQSMGMQWLKMLGFGAETPPVVQATFDSGADLLAGRYAKAQAGLARCLQLATQQSDSLAEAACANNQALVHAAEGRLGQARSELERALRLYETPRSPPADLKLPPEAISLMSRTLPAPNPEQMKLLPPEARAQIEARLREARKQVDAQMREMQSGTLPDSVRQGLADQWRKQERLTTARGIERTHLNLGNLALMAGQLAEARAQFEGAYENRVAGEEPACRTAAAMDLARLYRKIGRDDLSRELLAQSRMPGKPPDTDVTPFEFGAITLAAGRSLDNAPVAAAAPATQRASRADAALARAPSNRIEIPFAAASFSEPAGRLGDDSLAQLMSRAARDSAGQPSAEAIPDLQRLALRADAAGRTDLGYEAHSALMRLHMAAGQSNLAILHGKQAANLAQSTRTNLVDGSPSRDARRAFLRARRQLYVSLARLLLDQSRLVEAEAVLQVLKEDEGQQFLDPNARTQPGRFAYLPIEQTLLSEDEAARHRLLEAERKRSGATSKLPMTGVVSMLNRDQVEAARLRFGSTLADLPATLSRKPLHDPGSNRMAQELMGDLRDFFVGRDGRLHRFMSHLLEDAPKFTPPVDAPTMSRLADTMKRLKAIQAELAPFWREEGWVQAPLVSVRIRPPGAPPLEDDWSKPLEYATAEPLEQIWRSAREADDVEERHLRQLARRANTRAVHDIGDASAALTLADDTRAVLAQQPVATALLYYLPGDDRLDILLVSSAGRRHWRLPGADLEGEVQSFAKQMRNAAADPRAAAQALYTRLYAPVADAVSQSGAKVVALSLTGTLRFVPFAALHDGQRWLIERHAVAVHPGGALSGRLKPASGNWRVAAFGASRGAGEFSPLPNVPRELRSIVRSASDSGVLPGEAWLDQAFTAQRLRAALAAGVPVVHIASHFKFERGDAEASKMLLGDGSTLSLRDLAGADYRFDRTELVTLSACATGLSADDVYGQEVDGLAALLMGQGAPSVLASLWEVNDGSTATLMASMYRVRETERLARALALQQAQVAMIRSADAAANTEKRGSGDGRGVSRVRLPGDPEDSVAPSTYEARLNLGQGHPFHWAAFVLMGNWQ